MAEYKGASAGLRIFVLLLLIVVLVLGGLIWFDYLGVLDAKDALAPILGVFGIARRAKIEAVEDPLLLERERLEQQLQAVQLKEQELSRQEQHLAEREVELEQMIEEVTQKEASLAEREKSFIERLNAYENRRVNLLQLAEYLIGMPPQDAVDILEEKDDQEIIDLFRVTEERAQEADEQSLVSYWLSLMPEKRAAELTRKMTRKAVQQ